MGLSSNERPKGFYVSNMNLPEKDRTENWREAASPLYEALEDPSKAQALSTVKFNRSC